MVSQNERQRLAITFNRMEEKLARQKASIERLMLANTEASAALMEIESMAKENHRIHEWENVADRASARARQAIERMSLIAAAKGPDKGESEESGEPTPSEENHGTA